MSTRGSAGQDERSRAELAPAPRPSRRVWLWRTLRYAGLAALALLFWARRLQPPAPAGHVTIELDPSWQRASAYFFVNAFQAGVDYVFTFGPLGWVHTSNYDAGLFWQRVVAWEGLFQLAAAALLVRVLLRLPGLLDRVLFATLIVTFNPYVLGPFVTLAAVGALLIDSKAVGRAWFAVSAVLLCGLALVKFTFLVFASGCAAAIAWDLARRLSAGAALRWSALVASVFVALWLLCGQSPWNLPAYLSTSLEIARGYPAAMGLTPERGSLALAAATLALAAVHVAVRWGSAWRERLPEALLLGTGLLLAYKANFVRHVDSSTFFVFASVAPFLLPPPFASAAGASRSRRIALGATKLAWVGCAFYGSLTLPRGLESLTGIPDVVQRAIAANLDFLGHLPETRAHLLEHERALERRFALPRIRHRLGGEPVDLVSSSQAVLMINGFAYRPRPVFQSYAAYTPELSELNARFYESERAPRFVVTRLATSEDALPSMNDGAVLRVLLRDYDPVIAERGYLLIERRKGGPLRSPPSDVEPIARTIRFDDTVELGPPPGVCRTLFLDVRSTWRNRLRALVSHPARVSLELTLASGDRRTFLINPSMVREGVLLDPLIQYQSDVARWFAGIPLGRVVRLRVLVPKYPQRLFEPEIGLRIEADPELPLPEARPRQPRLVYSMFGVMPQSVETGSPPVSVFLWNLEVLLVHAPSRLTFAVKPGKRKLEARFGIMPDAWTSGVTFGVLYRAWLRRADGTEELLFERALDPLGDPDDRGMHELEADFETEEPAQVVLTTEPRVAGHPERCWAFWTVVRLTAR